MTSKNDVTGDSLISKANSDKYRDNWELIFGKKEVPDIQPKVINEHSK